ncbi:NYN domain-containing protein [Aerococcus sanguinicola]|uniref:DNA-binding protein n=1 Tax=Aerococcus sanguinicola TaxID=119206 RepID=A0A109RDH7_9LACT|nr:NYN domain-containing protein [Aerococcus sanguinicola]AMB94101.1 DNA-binding protein [Aerococcus sanguinicola]
MKRNRLIVDGYNMIGSWPPLKRLKDQDQIEEARDLLLELLSNYAAYHNYETWVVFDAMFVPGLSQTYDQYKLHVVYTAEKETADAYIEAMMDEMVGVLRNVTVATSDLAEQRMVFQKGALRKSANELWHDIQKTQLDISQGDENYDPNAYRRMVPWSYQQMRDLKSLLEDLSK